MSQHRPGHEGLTVGTTSECHKPALSTAEVMSNEGPIEKRALLCANCGSCSPSHAMYAAVGTATDCILQSRVESKIPGSVVAVESLSGGSHEIQR